MWISPALERRQHLLVHLLWEAYDSLSPLTQPLMHFSLNLPNLASQVISFSENIFSHSPFHLTKGATCFQMRQNHFRAREWRCMHYHKGHCSRRRSCWALFCKQCDKCEITSSPHSSEPAKLRVFFFLLTNACNSGQVSYTSRTHAASWDSHTALQGCGF